MNEITRFFSRLNSSMNSEELVLVVSESRCRRRFFTSFSVHDNLLSYSDVMVGGENRTGLRSRFVFEKGTNELLKSRVISFSLLYVSEERQSKHNEAVKKTAVCREVTRCQIIFEN